MSLASTWASAAREGFSSLFQGELKGALAHWRTARALAVNEEKLGSPCLTFAHNNCGVVALLFGEMGEAQNCFQNAGFSLERSAARLASEEVIPFAASSSHHLRLALRHATAFGEAHRRRLSTLLDGQREILRVNAGMCATSNVRCDADLIAQALGEGSLSTLLARGGTGDPEAVAAIGRAREDFAALASDLLSRRGPSSFAFLVERSAELMLVADPLLAREAQVSASHSARPLHHKEP